MEMTLRSIAAMACALFTVACVPDVRYRYFPDQSCSHEPCVNLPAQESGAGWNLSFVEFKDNGSPWDPLQTQRAVELIERAKTDNNGAVVVLLYIHGWKNNANEVAPPSRKDVEKFKTALNAVAAQVSHIQQGGRLPPLVGVYIGWRGLTATVEPIKTLTLWSRRATARHVGRTGIFDTIGQIVHATKGSGDDRSRLILVGHSFGSRVLENAVDGIDDQEKQDGPMLAWQKSLTAAAGTQRAPLPPVDLVVFVNAATQSSITEKTIGRLQAKHVVFYGPGGSPEICADDPAGDRRPQCRPLPLYVAVSSTGDLATRYLLPTADTLVPPKPLPLRIKSAAFTGRLQSHQVVEVDCPPPVPYRCEPNGAVEFCFEANRDEQRACYQVRRKPGSTNQTPFWDMTVDPRVVADHGDIWNQNLLDMFSAVLQRSRAADSSAPRTMGVR